MSHDEKKQCDCAHTKYPKSKVPCTCEAFVGIIKDKAGKQEATRLMRARTITREADKSFQEMGLHVTKIMDLKTKRAGK